jgi:predicted nucleic acid-binding protein
MVIVDASVAVAWYVGLPWSNAARQIPEQEPNLAAPSLILAEAANAFWKYVRAGSMTEVNGTAACEHLARAVSLVPLAELGGVAFNAAVRFDHPVYDCFYLALAQREQAKLLTADTRLATLAAKAGVPADLFR